MKKAFTLVELMIVIAIIAVLAALLFPVFAASKRQAFKTVDASNMRQLYQALLMYEQDFDAMPKSIAALEPTYAPREIFCSPLDNRPKADSYPADLYLTLQDEKSERVDYKVSYAYLHAFDQRFQVGAGLSWQWFRDNPRVGVLACCTHMFLQDSQSPHVMTDDGPLVDAGPLLRIRMDGSMKVIQRKNWGISVGGSYEELFLYE